MFLNSRNTIFTILLLTFCIDGTNTAFAATVPFTENFTADSANWFNATATAPVDWQAAGGPDGSSYATTGFNPVNSELDDTAVLFRAQDEFGSSGNQFVGDYLTEGVTEFSAFVRHDATVPLNFFVRFSSPINFPGGVAIGFVPVLPNVWTEITIPINAFNPQFVTFEGSDFATVFGNIGHVQVGPSIPAALVGVDANFTFDLDQPTIVPEPASGLMLLGVCVCTTIMMRRRRNAGC